jgi:nitrite reductase (NADH) small subunit
VIGLHDTGLVDVGAVEDFPEGKMRLVSVNGQEIGVLRWQGDLYAYRNVCPHQSGPLCEGSVGPRIVAASPGVPELDLEHAVIACPWHRCEFDIRTGISAWDSSYRVKTYPVVVQDDRVLVQRRKAR